MPLNPSLKQLWYQVDYDISLTSSLESNVTKMGSVAYPVLFLENTGYLKLSLEHG